MTTEEIYQKIEKIEGWFSLGECKVISPFLPKSGRIVELGTFHGRSTMFYSLACPDCEIITIDLCKQYDVKDTIPEAADQEVLDRPNVIQIPGDCLELGKNWKGGIDFLFIDTRHTYEDTLANLETWSRFVKKGGIIALHDFGSGFPGVEQAANEFLKNHPEAAIMEIAKGVDIGIIKL